MRELLSANLLRLRKSRLFWGTLAVTLAFSVFYMTVNVRSINRWMELGRTEMLVPMNDVLFGLMPLLGIVLATFLSLFLGTEYSDGTIRNRMLVGHTRAGIYFASLLTAALASLAVTAALLLGGLVGLASLEPWQGGWQSLASSLLVVLGIALSFAALFNLLGVLCTRKAAGAVAALLLSLALLMLSSYLYSALGQPEMTSDMRITERGIETSEPYSNPRYVGGALRTVYGTVLEILPTGQSVLLTNGEAVQPGLLFAASLGLSAAVSGAGAALFLRKDLK